MMNSLKNTEVRQGWADASKRIADAGDDVLVWNQDYLDLQRNEWDEQSNDASNGTTELNK